MRALIALACAAALAAAEPVPPAPDAGSPRDVDAITRRRAAEALAAHDAATTPAAPVDPALLDRLTAASGAVLEGEALLAKGQAATAGGRYLAAADLLKAFTADERKALGPRWTACEAAYTALGRGLAESADLGRAADAAAVAQPDGDGR